MFRLHRQDDLALAGGLGFVTPWVKGAAVAVLADAEQDAVERWELARVIERRMRLQEALVCCSRLRDATGRQARAARP